MRKRIRQLPKIKLLYGLKETLTLCLLFFICLELISINSNLLFERRAEQVPNYSIPQIEKKSIGLLERSNCIDSFPNYENKFQNFTLENATLLELVASNESVDFFEKLDSHQKYALDVEKDELIFIDFDSSLVDFMPKE